MEYPNPRECVDLIREDDLVTGGDSVSGQSQSILESLGEYGR